MRSLRHSVPRGILHLTNFGIRTLLHKTALVARLSEERSDEAAPQL